MADVVPGARVSKLPLVIMGGLIALAVLVTVALVGFPRTQSFDPDTPEAVVQQFIEAGIDDDQDTALGLLTASQRRICTNEFDDDSRSERFFGEDLRAILESTTIDDTEATVNIEFRRSSNDDPFDGIDRSFDARYQLVRVGDAWQVDTAGWPSSFDRCTKGGSR